MRPVVVDASVVVKWVLRERSAERDVELALALLDRIASGEMEMWQPPHWLAEVGGVLARLSPDTAEDDMDDLYALHHRQAESAGLYRRGCQLSIELNHHLFDTLYHAAAVEAGAVLVTADDRYFRKAAGKGAILRLRDAATLLDV